MVIHPYFLVFFLQTRAKRQFAGAGFRGRYHCGKRRRSELLPLACVTVTSLQEVLQKLRSQQVIKHGWLYKGPDSGGDSGAGFLRVTALFRQNIESVCPKLASLRLHNVCIVFAGLEAEIRVFEAAGRLDLQP